MRATLFLGGLMKRLLVVLLALTSMCSFAEPITTFPYGTYLGEGLYYNSDGEQGTYSSFVQMIGNDWNLAYVRDGVLTSYSATFDFVNGSLFDVAVTHFTEEGQQIDFAGYGYCASVQCHLVLDLDDYVFEETITFATWENKLYRLGSIRRKVDEEIKTLLWEEALVKIDRDSPLTDQ